jgi:hypothetical protein
LDLLYHSFRRFSTDINKRFACAKHNFICALRENTHALRLCEKTCKQVRSPTALAANANRILPPAAAERDALRA